MAAMSAAMLSVLANSSSATMAVVSQTGNTFRMLAARPLPVSQPTGAHLSLDADHQRGRERRSPQEPGPELRTAWE